MKNTVLALGLVLVSGLGFGQNLVNPPSRGVRSSITDPLSVGYAQTPAFGNFKLKVNGPAHLEQGLVIGDFSHFGDGADAGFPNPIYGLRSTRPMVVHSDNEVASIDVIGKNGAFIQMAVAQCAGCYAHHATPKDAVLRSLSGENLIFANGATGNFLFESGANLLMKIDRNGGVGIGTGKNPIPVGEKLAVNGLIHAKEVKVDLQGWPYYVFEKQYQLPSLEAVEKNIQEKGHLINIPSAKEIETSGLLLGDISKKQQEKIEELTLYLIEQNKTNKEQAKQIEELKTLVNQLIEKK